MQVTTTVDGTPVIGMTEVSVQVVMSDHGVGQLVAEHGALTVEPSDGSRIAVQVDGVEVGGFDVEEYDGQFSDDKQIAWSGRDRTAQFERTVVLPESYPAHTQRQREFAAFPLAIWRTLALEAQARGRLSWLALSFDATQDSNGVPWDAVIDTEIEPGVNLSDLLEEMRVVENCEWLLQPDGTLDVARDLGVDRSAEVVLWVGRAQISRGRRSSSRDVRDTVYLETSTGVSEAANSSDGGEIWLEGEDFVGSRAAVAARLAELNADPTVEVAVEVDADCGIFDTFNVGDSIGLDDGETVSTVRVVAATVRLGPDGPHVELTFVSAAQLRTRRLERAIQQNADVKLAANTSLQRRHGLVRADKIEAGSLQVDSFVESSDYDTGVAGWKIDGAGDAEFNDVVVRGTVDASNITGSTITGSTITGSTMIAGTGGEVVIDFGGISVSEGAGVANAIAFVDGGGVATAVLRKNAGGGLEISSAGNIFLGGGMLAGNVIVPTTLEAWNTVFVRDGDPAPATTTPRAMIDQGTPRILAVADSDAAAVFGRNSDGTVVNFRRSGSTVGSISVTAAATAYNTSSDARLKTDIVDVYRPAALQRILSLRPRDFRWRDGGEQSRGLIAQEVLNVLPEITSVADDGTMLVGYSNSVLIADLIAAVQEIADAG